MNEKALTYQVKFQGPNGGTNQPIRLIRTKLAPNETQLALSQNGTDKRQTIYSKINVMNEKNPD